MGKLLEIFAYPTVTVVHFTDQNEFLRLCIVSGLWWPVKYLYFLHIHRPIFRRSRGEEENPNTKITPLRASLHSVCNNAYRKWRNKRPLSIKRPRVGVIFLNKHPCFNKRPPRNKSGRLFRNVTFTQGHLFRLARKTTILRMKIYITLQKSF